jgi:phosphotransferase system enzyme I (PtsI)
MDVRFKGLPISGGLAVARVCRFMAAVHAAAPSYKVEGEAVAREKDRLTHAVDGVVAHIESTRKVVLERIGAAEAEIFAAQKLVLQDPALQRGMAGAIEGGFNAERAVLAVLDSYEARLLEAGDEYLRERASDIGELKRRLVNALGNANPAVWCDGEGNCRRGRDRIVIVRELTPALTLELDSQHVLGFVTERGGPTSHAAILARALGIPAVSGIDRILNLVNCGTEVLVDGDSGEIVVWPSETTVRRASAEARAVVRSPSPVEPVESLTVMANISLADEAEEASRMLAEGIGLYRTEFEFFAAGKVLSEEEQAARYTRVLEAMAGKPVYFRLLDIGGDKASHLFDCPREENPALGLRGARFLLARPDLVRTQARALALASRRGPIHVMYPMIVDVAQFLALRKLFDEATDGLRHGEIRHGAMIEVPSAALRARELMLAGDFVSVGSNDLVQYLFAVDRNNEHVAHDYSPDRAAFWDLLAGVVRAAAETGRAASVCGEIAADPRYIVKLMALGVDRVSVSARHVPDVRRLAADAFAGRKSR